MIKLPNDPLCPVCKELLSGVSRIGGEQIMPDPGDASICIYCATALEFDKDLNLKIMSEETLQEIVQSECGDEFVTALKDIAAKTRESALIKEMLRARPDGDLYNN